MTTEQEAWLLIGMWCAAVQFEDMPLVNGSIAARVNLWHKFSRDAEVRAAEILNDPVYDPEITSHWLNKEDYQAIVDGMNKRLEASE